jgi:hypothetical protein
MQIGAFSRPVLLTWLLLRVFCVDASRSHNLRRLDLLGSIAEAPECTSSDDGGRWLCETALKVGEARPWKQNERQTLIQSDGTGGRELAARSA